MSLPHQPAEEPFEAAWNAGDFARVEALAGAALAAAPGDAWAQAWLGLARWTQGAPAEAREALAKAVAGLPGPGAAVLAPALAALLDRLVQHPAHGGPAAARLVVESLGLEHPASLRVLAWEAAQAGDVAGGVALLRRGLAQDAADPEGHYLLARLLARLGKRPNALRHLRAALAEPTGQLARRRGARHEPDFDTLRADPDFQDLMGTLPMEEVLRPLYAALDRGELERAVGLAPGLLAIARHPLDVLLPWQEALERLAAAPGGEAHARALEEVARRLAPYQARGELSQVYLAFQGHR